MYGDEETNTPPELLYSDYDAQQSIKMAEEVLEYARNYMKKKNEAKCLISLTRLK
jgi:hypothetical protein